MKGLESLKQVIYWVGLGVSLVVYAHANFSTTNQVEKIESRIDRQATKEDIARLEAKIDTIQLYLMER